MNIINLCCLNNRFKGAASSLSSRTGCMFEKIYEYKKGNRVMCYSNGRSSLNESAPAFFLLFSEHWRETWWRLVVKRPQGTIKTPATFRRNNRQSVRVLSCYRKKQNKGSKMGIKVRFHSETLSALGCCARRLSRKEKEVKSARSRRRRTSASTRLQGNQSLGGSKVRQEAPVSGRSVWIYTVTE